MELPIGCIFPYYGGENDLRDEKYLFCNGRNITKTAFPALYQLLISANPDLRVDDENCKLPDFRGFFIRGLDTTGNVDPDRNRPLGSQQDANTQAPIRGFSTTVNGDHNHSVGIPIDITAVGQFPRPIRAVLKAFAHQQTLDTATSSGGNHSHAVVGGDFETRPKNIAVNYIIRAKP